MTGTQPEPGARSHFLSAAAPRHGGKDAYGFVGGHTHSSPSMVAWYERSEVLAGAADIFWEPGGEHASEDAPG